MPLVLLHGAGADLKRRGYTMSENGLNISRRGFVAGAGAAALGAGLVGCSSGTAEKEGTDLASTAPEKVAYDPEAGEWIPTTCNMCFNNCSIKAHVIDGVVVELTGNPDSPVGSGHICGKGAAGIMQLYDPNRITKPLKRTNPKKGFDEDPGWVEISWDEAFQTMDDIIHETLAKNPFGLIAASAVANLGGSALKSAALSVIYQTMVEPSNSDICGAGVHQVSDLFAGTGNAMPDYEYCNYLLQFGTQAGTATRHGYNMTASIFAERRDNGLRLVNFDPHMSAGGQKADLWVPLRPGTDAAAALSIAFVLVHELDLFDREFLTNRTNGPALVDVATGRIIREEGTNKALFMDGDNTVKPYDACTAPQLEGTFEVEGKQCSTGFTLYKEHLKTYTPEYQEAITTIPAATIRQVAKEFGEAACIGETIEVNGVTLPYRPACADSFSGITRHKHSFHNNWSVMSLNALIGSANSVGGFIGYAPQCQGWADGNQNAAWSVDVWEPDGLITANTLMMPAPHNVYDVVYNGDLTPTNLALQELMPFSMDPHFTFLTQAHPEMYHREQERPEVMFVYGTNPIKWWGNFDEQAEIYKSYKYVIGCDIYLNESSYFYDLVLPEACYLERREALSLHFLNHRNIGGVSQPWPVTAWQPVVEPKDGVLSSLHIFAELADRNGKNAEFISVMNMMYRVKEELSVDLTKKLDPEEFTDSVLKSNIDEEHGVQWFRDNGGVYTYPRKVEEVYIWADGRPGRVPLYFDFMLECKKRVEEKVAELDIPWETDDYQPLPDWKPCCDFEVTNPEFDILPVYYTDAINTDSWNMENPWINEINEANPYGYTVEMNKATAAAKGLASGDGVRLSNVDGVSIEGKLAVSEGIHPECVSVIGGHWGSRSAYAPLAQGKGSPIVHLIPGTDPKRYDHVCAAFDQCVRIKVEKIA